MLRTIGRRRHVITFRPRNLQINLLLMEISMSVARNVYSKEANVFVQECGLIVSQSEPWMAYSPDGVIIENSDTFRLLEIKCPYDLENTIDNSLLKKCKFLHMVNNNLNIRKKTTILWPNSVWHGCLKFK